LNEAGVLLSAVSAAHRFSKRIQVSLRSTGQGFDGQTFPNPAVTDAATDRNWHAVYTIPQHEKTVVKHLEMREIESFLPVYETVRVWKNRQRMKIVLPLFPTYLFVHISLRERARVLQSPGVLQIVGNGMCACIPDSEVEFLRSGFCRQRIEPYRELVIGKKVRIKSGVMQGLQGTLVRKSNRLRFVLTVESIHQHAAIQVNAEDLEPIAV
jgi:transcription antitermination factor NusG